MMARTHNQFGIYLLRNPQREIRRGSIIHRNDNHPLQRTSKKRATHSAEFGPQSKSRPPFPILRSPSSCAKW